MRGLQAPTRQDARFSLQSERLGPLPLVNAFLQRMGLEALLEQYVPTSDRRNAVSHAQALGVLLRSIIVEREPIYRQQETVCGFAPGLFGLGAQAMQRLTDDRIGRALDRLFDADRGGLLTQVVVTVGQRFGVAFERLHNDSTSISFCGQYRTASGRELRGRSAPAIVLGFSKDHRPDLNQMVVGAVLDSRGRPLCCEMWPGNTTDVKTLLPVAERIRKRFQVGRFCLVADRGMISKETLQALDDPQTGLPYILGVRMRKVKEVREEVLSRAGAYREVHPEGTSTKEPSPLKVKEAAVNGRRYIICLNPRQARKDQADREAILASLEEQLKKGAKALVGNRGFRRYLKSERDAFVIDYDKAKQEARFDGKWVITTNTRLSAEQVALKYKELWQVEQLFRDTKSLLETRPVFHQRNDTIRGHVFCSFLALVLKKELFRRMEASGQRFEWSEIKQDLKSLQEITLEEDGKRLAIRTQCQGTCGKVFQAVGVAIPPTIRHLAG